MCLSQEVGGIWSPRLGEAEEWQQVELGSLLSSQEGPKCMARRAQSIQNSGRAGGNLLLAAPVPAFSTYSTSSFVILQVSPALPKVKCKKEPGKGSRGMAGLTLRSQQTF